MNVHARLLAALAVGALVGAPAAGAARQGQASGGCKAGSAGFSLGGRLVSLKVGDPDKLVKKAAVTLRVTSRSAHARRSGRVGGAGTRFTVPASDTFVLRLNGYDDGGVPVAGDPVTVSGTIALRKARCVPAGARAAARYGAIDVRAVTVADR